MAWRSGRATRALLVTVGLSSTAIAAYFFLRRKTDASSPSNEAMAQIDASLKAGSAADEGVSAQEKPVESKTVAKSSDKVGAKSQSVKMIEGVPFPGPRVWGFLTEGFDAWLNGSRRFIKELNQSWAG